LDKPFSAYRGDGPYVFVCYAHEDSEAIYREIAWLNDYGVNVWYDEGISPGHEWTDELASAIQGCTRFLYFVTPNSVISEHCRRELNFAQEEGRELLAIHLEETEVPPGLRLSLNNRQAILKHDLPEADYHKQLIRVTRDGGAPSPRSDDETIASPAKSRFGFALAVATLALIAAGVWWSNLTDESTNEIDELVAEPEKTVPHAVLRNSIAVLPFDNLSPNPDNAYFAAGIHEETLGQLAKIKDLSVIARTTMTRYAGSNKSVPEIGNELNVRTVMEGSVRYSDNRVRIGTQLIDVATGTPLWSETYERDLEDIFSIQSDIATNITRAMKAEFAIAEQQAIATPLTTSPAAYAEYVKAVELYARLPLPLEEGMVHLEAAIEHDPNFTKALGYAAQAYGVISFTGTDQNPLTPENHTANRERAFVLANRALALNPNQSDAHIALNYVAMADRRWSDALEFARRAYDLNPAVPTAALRLANELSLRGEAAEARRLIDRAMELDPLNVNLPSTGLFYMSATGEWPDMLRYARHTIAMVPELPGPYIRGAIAAHELGDREAALQFLRDAEARQGSLPEVAALRMLIRAYGRLEMPAKAEDAYKRLLALAEVDQLNDADWFILYMGLGRLEQAISHAEKIVETNFPPGFFIQILALNPDASFFDPIRAHPDFDSLVAKAHAAAR
jgi:adenylate cyclase